MAETVLDGRYVLESELGRGGMGVVYRARDLQLHRPVAVKVLPAEFTHDQQFLQRFRNEVLNAARLQHPHVVQVHDVGEDGGTYYYVMQLIEGSDLRSKLQGRGRLVPDEAAKLIGQVAQALDYAHKQGIVHRDIKPENVLLDEEETARVVDFGIARSLEGTRLTGGMIGTPEYMSPEQARGEDVDGRSDQYSLGVMAYEMLTGATPFRTETKQPWSYVNDHISTPPPDPRSRGVNLPQPVADALMRALAKVPAHRFATCAEFAAALAGTGGATMAGPIPPEPRPRRSAMPAFLAVFIVALLAGGIWLLSGRRGQPAKSAPPSHPPVVKTGQPKPPAPGSNPPGPPAAASDVQPIAREDIQAVLERWLSAQNARDFRAYDSCYAPDFQGVKRTVSGRVYTYGRRSWLADRQKMMSRARRLQVTAENRSITLGPGDYEAAARFLQYYRSERYSDKGDKLMKFRKDRSTGRVAITYEELTWSQRI